MIIDAGPLITDAERINSRLWALIKAATLRGEEIHTTHPVLCQVWRDPKRQANLARLVTLIDVHALDESRSVGTLLAASKTSDVVDAHLTTVAEMLGTFVLTADPADMTKLGARFETY
ncbi:MAG: hypothetical protein KAZ88_08670 [Acidimicrobiia bacterium]|nr:hypothetical protein [Acidimicrobiia bacterium]MBP8181052.1 hypothetical protein [Acidimicrobiia bacterium]